MNKLAVIMNRKDMSGKQGTRRTVNSFMEQTTQLDKRLEVTSWETQLLQDNQVLKQSVIKLEKNNTNIELELNTLWQRNEHDSATHREVIARLNADKKCILMSKEEFSMEAIEEVQLQIELQSQWSMVSQLQEDEQSLQQELNMLHDQCKTAGDELRRVKEDVKMNDSQMQVNKS